VGLFSLLHHIFPWLSRSKLCATLQNRCPPRLMKLFLPILLFAFCYLVLSGVEGLLTIPVNAAFLCEPVYGGGLSEFCIQKPTPIQSGPTPKKEEFAVFPPPQLTKSPATGPEALPLIGIISSGVVGLLLRKKFSKS